jgi:hypothetical protein
MQRFFWQSNTSYGKLSQVIHSTESAGFLPDGMKFSKSPGLSFPI